MSYPPGNLRKNLLAAGTFDSISFLWVVSPESTIFIPCSPKKILPSLKNLEIFSTNDIIWQFRFMGSTRLPRLPGVWMLDIHGFFPRHLTGVSGSAKLFPRFNLKSAIPTWGSWRVPNPLWVLVLVFPKKMAVILGAGDPKLKLFTGISGVEKKTVNTPFISRPFREGGGLKNSTFLRSAKGAHLVLMDQILHFFLHKLGEHIHWRIPGLS